MIHLRTGTSLLAFIATATLCLASASASAQDAASPAGTTAADSVTPDAASGDIVVTAQKREQSIQTVPIAIQALTAEKLTDQHVRDLTEVITFVPGASEELSNNLGARKYQIRGISAGLGGDSTVGYYFGDSAFTFIGQTFAPSGRAFDMNRIEVLRGPQSTLYGNGAMGGVIRFIPNDPNLQRVETHARGGYSFGDGADDGYYGDVAVSVPLVNDKLALRVVGSYERVGGYQEVPSARVRNYDGGHLLDIRAALLFKPSDDFDLRLTYIRNEAKQSGSTLLSSTNPPVGAGFPGDYNNNLYSLYAATARGNLGFATLSSTSTYIKFDRPLFTSLPFIFSPSGFLTIASKGSAKGVSNETRLTSNAGPSFQWVTGVFYSGSNYVASTVYTPAVVPPGTTKTQSDAVSVFGEVSYGLADGRITPLVGLRYFTDRRSSRPIVGAPGTPLRDTFHSINPRFNLSFQPDRSANYYINVAKGFRSGQFNIPATCAVQRSLSYPCADSVPSDKLWSYEIGTKQALFGRQLRVEASAYYIDWTDITQSVPVIGVYETYQVGDARLYGLDLGVSFNPAAIPGLSIDVIGNVNHAAFRNLRPVLAAVTGAKNGDRLPFTPAWTLAATLAYDRPIGGDWHGLVSAGYNHLAAQQGQFGSNANGESRDLMRVRIGVHDRRFGLYAFGTNLLNESGPIYAQQPTGGAPVFTRDYPRTIGVEATLDF